MLIDRRQMLAAAGATLALRPEAAASGPVWRNLLEGADLARWRYREAGVERSIPSDRIRIGRGTLHLLASPEREPEPFGYIATAVPHARCQLHAEFRWGTRRAAPRAFAKRNSGIMYHVSPNARPSSESFVEFQIQESNVGDMVLVNLQATESPAPGGTTLWPPPVTSGRPTSAPPVVHAGISRQWFRSSGDFEKRQGWNSLDIVVFDDLCAHIVNGRIVTAAYGVRPLEATSAPPPSLLPTGHIGLQLEAAEIHFRAVRIRSIANPLDIIL